MSGETIGVLSDDRLFSEGLSVLIRSVDASLDVCDYDESSPPPDMVLIDSRMNGAMSYCGFLKRAHGPAVIMVAAPDEDAWASCALGSGARGIVPKSARPEEMVSAIRTVRDGSIWARRRVLAATIDILAKASAKHYGGAMLEQRLSAREREVFRQAATGLANKEVAGRLGMSEATVKAHLTHIFQKLGVHCRSELAAAFHGIISPAATT